MTKQEIMYYLSGKDDADLYARSRHARFREFGDRVFLRGLVEFSNHCACDCLYCGIRKSGVGITRYSLGVDEVREATRVALDRGYVAVVLQCGENRSSRFSSYVVELVRAVKEVSKGFLEVTLSCGVQSEEVYRLWRDAGADRYLLRIESSTKELFEKIHPPEINFDERLSAIHTLCALGYKTGSGVMVGLPYQTVENLADDIVFLSDSSFAMCGMGPYIEHCNTPLGVISSMYSSDERIALTLRSLALLRIIRPTINIAASTALNTLSQDARDFALYHSANVLMPNITPPGSRQHYNLYEGKVINE